jgi:hypothetical protein
MSNYSKDEAIKELQKKLEIEKAKFNKFVEDLKEEGCKRCLRNGTIVLGTFYDLVDELSSKQEKKHCENCGCELETKFEIKEGWCDNCNLPERSNIK